MQDSQRGSNTRASTEAVLTHLGLMPTTLTVGSNGGVLRSVLLGLGVTVVAHVGRTSAAGDGTDLDDHAGLARSHPVVDGLLALFLACLAGLPPGLAGLFAKIVVVHAVVIGGYGWLAAAGVVALSVAPQAVLERWTLSIGLLAL